MFHKNSFQKAFFLFLVTLMSGAQAANMMGSLGADPTAVPSVGAPDPSAGAASSGDPSQQQAPASGAPGAPGGTPAVGMARFQGFSLGASIGAEHISAKLEGNSFSGTGADGGLVVGYGKGLTESVYLGGELGVRYGSSNMKQDTYKLRGTYSGEIAGVAGWLPQGGRFMPYVKLGTGFHGYEYFAGQLKTPFNIIFVAPGLGVQGLLTDHFLMRIEASYTIPVGASKISKAKLTQKPKKAVIQLSGLYKF